MNQLCRSRMSGWLVAAFLVAALPVQTASGPDTLLITAQLVWGTNDPVSPDPTHHDIAPDLAAKLRSSANRWTNYFEVKRVVAAVSSSQPKTLSMSDRCAVEIKNLGGDVVEVKLIGEGKALATQKEKLIPNWPLVLAGPAKNQTAWMVVLTKAPANAKPDPDPAPKPAAKSN